MSRAVLTALLIIGIALVGIGVWSLRALPPPLHVTALAAEPQRIIDDAPFKQAPPVGTSLVGGGTPGQSRGVAPKDERIRFTDLPIDLPVVEGDGYNAPLNKAAHFPGLPWPGQGGRSVLYAHARPGMFGPLFDAKVGQRFEISSSDGPLRRYAITEYYQHWPVSDTRWLTASDLDEVVLVTCTTYNPNDPRIIVVARPV